MRVAVAAALAAGAARADPMASSLERPKTPPLAAAEQGPDTGQRALNQYDFLPTGSDDLRSLGILSGFALTGFGLSHWQDDGARTPNPWLVTENASLQNWQNLLIPQVGTLYSNLTPADAAMDYSSRALFASRPAEIARLTDPASGFWQAPSAGAPVGSAVNLGPGAPVQYANVQSTPESSQKLPGDDEDAQFRRDLRNAAVDVIERYFDVQTAGARQRLLSVGDSDTAIMIGPSRKIELVNLATGDSLTLTKKFEPSVLGNDEHAKDDDARPGTQQPGSVPLETISLGDVLQDVFLSPFALLLVFSAAMILLFIRFLEHNLERDNLSFVPPPPPRKRKRRRRRLDAAASDAPPEEPQPAEAVAIPLSSSQPLPTGMIQPAAAPAPRRRRKRKWRTF